MEVVIGEVDASASASPRKYSEAVKQLFDGEIGKLYGVRFVESTEAKIFKGEALTAAAEAYSRFLLELAADRREDADLRALLADADGKLEVALEEARKYDIERTKR